MTGSKVILIGAISVVFGLYTLSLTKIQSGVGMSVERQLCIQKAEFNARSGVQRALHRWSTGNFEASYGPMYVDEGYYYYTSTTSNIWPWTVSYLASHPNYYSSFFGTYYPNPVQLTVVSHGVYKAPGEPAAFYGHEVIRMAYFEFQNRDITGSGWYDVKLISRFDSVNYARERQLDSLQQYSMW